jgi:hypothetical protein
MTTVFIGGSGHITRLTSDVRARLDRIVGSGLPVVVGDANGADQAVQGYLAGRHHESVEVFSSDESPRNNLGGWPVRIVRPTHRARDFDYYVRKVRDYLLSATHPVGRHKARFFAALGFAETSTTEFIGEIRRIAATENVVSVEDTEFGRKYTVGGELSLPRSS